MGSEPSTARHTARLVCFDLGGVLVRTTRSWNEAYRAAGLDDRAVPASADIDARHRELESQLEAGQISLDGWAEGVSLALLGSYNAHELKRAHHAITQEEHPGALALIDELHEASIATACLSNTNHAHWVRLVHSDGSRPLDGPPEYPAVRRLQHHVASHLVRLVKPDAAIYDRFERLTGARGTEILFFDDRKENVAAARRHGWLAEWINARLDTIPQIRKRLRGEGWL